MSDPITLPRQHVMKGLRVAPGSLGVSVAIVAAVAWPLVFTNPFLLTIGSLVAIYLIASTSLHMVIRMGHISFAHAGMMGIGAYVSADTMMKLSFPFALSVSCAAAASALVGLAIGPIVLRLTGKYFVLVTFLLGEIIRMVFVDWTSLTGGSNGIQGIPPPFAAVASPRGYYYFALGCSLMCMAFCGRILSSEIGRAMDSAKEAEPLAASCGVPIVRLKVVIFTISCGLAGISGALLVHLLRYADPTAFGGLQSLNLVIMNVIGGMGSIYGAIIGTIFLTTLPELLRSYVELQRVIYGIILIVVMAAMPGGLVGLMDRLRLMTASNRKN